ncbi:MAG: BrnA antitoxin family protein [Sphingomonadaceae bacterium]|nr:BrnA antitoxin family protein [Sphingomonadaceae bacterium]
MSKTGISAKSAGRAADREAAFEGEVPELSEEDFRSARIRVGDTIVREARPRRGRPPRGDAPLVQQTLRLSPAVIAHFRATGPGWHARINQALLEAIKHR